MGTRIAPRGFVSDSSGYARLFNSDLKEYSPSGKAVQRIRILPALDPNLSPADGAYKTSVAPYRNLSSTPDAAGNFGYSGWFMQILAYKFWGRAQEAFLSPALLGFMGGHPAWEMEDPINLLRRAVVRKVREDKQTHLEKFYKKPEGAGKNAPRPILSGASELGLMNALLATEGNWVNVLYTISGLALEDLLDQASWPRPASEPTPRDAKWPDYILGDITDPKLGIVWTTEMKSNGTTSFNGLTCGVQTNARNSAGLQVLPVPGLFLDKRADLCDSDLYRIPSKQEVVAKLLDQPELREISDLVEEVFEPICEVRWPKRWDMASTAPSAPAVKAASAPSAHPDEADVSYDEEHEQVTTTAEATPQMPAPQVAAQAVHVGVPNGSVYLTENGSAPALMEWSAIAAAVRVGKVGKLAQVHVNGVWSLITQHLPESLWAPVAPPPPPPPPPVPSAPPPPPPPPAAPTEPAAPTDATALVGAAVADQAAPTLGAPPAKPVVVFTPEDAAEMSSLQAIVQGPGPKTPEHMKRLRELISKKAAAGRAPAA